MYQLSLLDCKYHNFLFYNHNFFFIVIKFIMYKINIYSTTIIKLCLITTIIIIMKMKKINTYLKYINILLTIIIGSYGVNKLFKEKLYWNYISNIFFQNRIIYKNTSVLNNFNNGCIIISNHVNVSDLILIRNKIDCYVVGKDCILSKEYPQLYFINNMFYNNLKIISYKKKNLKSGEIVKNKILSIVSRGENVLVFPEGSSQVNCHNEILPFNKGLFYLAYENNIPILPVVIYYTDSNYGLDKKTRFSLNKLLENKTDIIVKFFETQLPNDYENVDNLVNKLHTTMNQQILKYNKKYLQQIIE